MMERRQRQVTRVRMARVRARTASVLTRGARAGAQRAPG